MTVYQYIRRLPDMQETPLAERVKLLAEANATLRRSFMAQGVELRRERQVAAHAKRLALELECLLVSCRDTAAVSTWWDSAHEALAQYQADIDQIYRDPAQLPTQGESNGI